MRVLQFVSTLNRNSGVMRVIMNYYKKIDREKIQFDFLYFIESDDSYRDEIIALGGKVHFVPKPGTSFHSVKELCHFFQQHGKNYTWLHNHESYLTILLYPLAKQCGIQNVIVHAHLTKYSDKSLSAIRNAIMCFPIKFLPVQRMACSKAAGKFLYGKNKSVYVLRNLVDSQQYVYDAKQREQIRCELGIQNAFVIGHVGRFQKQKNHIFLIEVFAAFYQTHPDSRLLLVGDGSLEAEIRSLVQAKQLEDVTIFAGMQKNITSYLSAMDVFLLPSLFEGLPMVALEAQANGLECILADTITEETALSDRVQFCSLEDKQAWLDWLRKEKMHFGYDRKLPEQVKETMNLSSEARKLEQYYMQICRQEDLWDS